MKILIADDDAASRLLLGALLRKLGHTVIAVADGHAAWQAWLEEAPALVISDWMMPGMDGLSLCRAIRSQPSPHYTYLILLTALSGKGSYLDGMEAGADDFLSKPLDEDMLAARLCVATRILKLHEALKVQASHDHLTGVLNRGAVLEQLRTEIERGARENTWVGVMMIDLDHFKLVNDRYGHPIGDAVLVEAARRMQGALRSYDRLGRFGGEEFIIVAPGGDRALMQMIAERVQRHVSESPITTRAGELPLTFSAGVACCEPGGSDSIEALLSRADAALYRAKDAGRACIEYVDPA